MLRPPLPTQRNHLHGPIAFAPQLCVLPANVGNDHQPGDIKGNVLAANVCNDYQLGDIKGNADLLIQIVRDKKYTENDARLFLTGGLTGRRGNNQRVLDILIDGKKRNFIFAVASHHEDTELKVLNYLEMLGEYIYRVSIVKTEDPTQPTVEFDYNTVPPKDAEKIKALFSYLKDKVKRTGVWMIELFREEVRYQHISINAGNVVQYGERSRLKAYKDYLRSLPRLIHVKGTEKRTPFNVVPWEIPVDDATLQRMIDNVDKNNMPFSLEQVKHLSGEILNERRHATSVPEAGLPHRKKHWGSVLCFHGYLNVGAREIGSIDGMTKCYEPATNCIGLFHQPDITGFAFLFCSTKGTVQWYGDNQKIEGASTDWKRRKILYTHAGLKQEYFNRLMPNLARRESTEEIRFDLQYNLQRIRMLLDRPLIEYVCASVEFAVHTGCLTPLKRGYFYHSLVKNVRSVNPTFSADDEKVLLQALHEHGPRIADHLPIAKLALLDIAMTDNFAPKTVIEWRSASSEHLLEVTKRMLTSISAGV